MVYKPPAIVSDRLPVLRAALGFTLVPPAEPELRLLHRWLDCWSGIGHIVAGMAQQGSRLQLTEYYRRCCCGRIW